MLTLLCASIVNLKITSLQFCCSGFATFMPGAQCLKCLKYLKNVVVGASSLLGERIGSIAETVTSGCTANALTVSVD